MNDYLREHPDPIDRVFETLSYFATYNRITAEKEMTIYPFYGHSDGAAEQRERQIRCLAERVPGGQSRSPASYEGMRRDNE